MDVSSLYTNIDQDEGADACFEKLEQRTHKSIPSIILKKLILLVLRYNIFRFGSSFYTQIKGTCMGTPMAPNYANLFMDRFEETLLEEFYNKTGKKPVVWWRYIDDIFVIWKDGDESLKEFLNFTQNFSTHKKMKSNIKFTVSQSTEEVNFLDVRIISKNGNITTSVYSKPTDSHLYLNSKSNHPRHIIRNIPKSQFLRLRRICSDTADFMQQCGKYMKYFTQRGYNEEKLKNTIREVSSMKREDILEKPSPKNEKDQKLIFTCDWHPALSQLPSIIRKHHHLLDQDNELKSIFKDPPIVAFRRSRTIRQELIRSDVEPPSEIKDPFSPCEKSRCKMCHLVNQSDRITNAKNGKSIEITSGGNCRSSDVIYAARCKVCDLIYIGETQKEVRERFYGHRHDAKSRPDNCEFAEHVHHHKHDFEKDVDVTILKMGFKSEKERKYFEDKYICLLGTYRRKIDKHITGLNEKLGNYAKEMYSMYQDLG